MEHKLAVTQACITEFEIRNSECSNTFIWRKKLPLLASSFTLGCAIFELHDNPRVATIAVPISLPNHTRRWRSSSNLVKLITDHSTPGLLAPSLYENNLVGYSRWGFKQHALQENLPINQVKIKRRVLDPTADTFITWSRAWVKRSGIRISGSREKSWWLCRRGIPGDDVAFRSDGKRGWFQVSGRVWFWTSRAHVNG